MGGRFLLAILLAALLVAGCTSSTNASGTSDHGSTSTPAGPAPTSVQGGGFNRSEADASSAAPTSPSAAPSTPLPSGTPLEFTGSNTGNTYRATVLASDDVTDCAAHAYGQKMITFLTKNPCRGAHRVVATIVLLGRPVVVSIISTSFASSDPKDPFATAGAFTKLEKADCGCGLNDLLRDPGVPGLPDRIPDNEAFQVLNQDSGVTILDAWNLHGTTKDQDVTLTQLEADVFLSELASA